MILVDTGPLVALFDNKDAAHDRCARVLKGLREPLKTTIHATNAKDLAL